jgi:hypothetical protein
LSTTWKRLVSLPSPNQFAISGVLVLSHVLRNSAELQFLKDECIEHTDHLGLDSDEVSSSARNQGTGLGYSSVGSTAIPYFSRMPEILTGKLTGV